MRWTMTTLSISSLIVLGGCIRDLVAQGAELAPDSDTDTDTIPTTESPIPTGDGSNAQTVTSDPDSEAVPSTSLGSNSSDTTDDPPPTISLFDATPDLVKQAGVVTVQLVASDDVEDVELQLDGVFLEHFDTNEFSYEHEIFSAKDNKAARTFKVVVKDAAQQSAEAETTIAVVVPASGEQKCIFEASDRGKVVSSISAVRYTSDAIIAVGTREADAELKLTVWVLHPETCQLLPGWPLSIQGWSKLTDFVEGKSLGTAVDVDTAGNLVVAGNRIEGTTLQSYVALLGMNGKLKWEMSGALGEEVYGVAAGSERHKDRIVAVGAKRTGDNPPRTDGMIWIYQSAGNEAVATMALSMKAPFAPDEPFPDPQNLRSEWVRAVALHPATGNAVAVGEREFKAANTDINRRMFAAIVHPLTGVVGTPWTSPANAGLVNNAARSVAACSEGLVAGGWTRDEPVDAKPQSILFWLDADGSSSQQRTEPQLSPSQTNGIACDREGKVISAGTRTVDPTDAQVFAVTDPFSARIAYETGAPEDDGAGGVSCDSRGFCAWGGYRTLDNKIYAVVRAHHP